MTIGGFKFVSNYLKFLDTGAEIRNQLKVGSFLLTCRGNPNLNQHWGLHSRCIELVGYFGDLRSP